MNGLHGFVLFTLLQASGSGAASEADLEEVVRASNQCLKTEVNTRLPSDRIAVSDEERTAIRIAAVSACQNYNRELARFTSDYINGSKSLQTVADDMLPTSLEIANGFITVRLQANLEQKK